MGIAHSRGTPSCDKYFDGQCSKFNQLYYGDRKNPSCFNNNVGQEYICPQVGKGSLPPQQLGSWFAKERQGVVNNNKAGCHRPKPNIGVHNICANASSGTGANNQRGGASASSKSNFSTVNPGGAVPRVYAQHPSTGNPYIYDLSALGYDVKMPEQALSKDTMSFFGYGRMGCPWNPTCPCGADCPCGASCTCGQENTETKTNLGDVSVDLDNSIVDESAPEVTPRQDIKGNFHKVTGEHCTGRPAEEYMCNLKCDEDERGCPVNIRSCVGAGKQNYRFLCKDRLRCGNGQVANKASKCCKNCNFKTNRILSNPYNPSRQYGTQPEEVPSYYFDMTQEAIGQRPVYVKSHRERIPEILLCDTVQNQDKCFGCHQPCWNDKCM